VFHKAGVTASQGTVILSLKSADKCANIKDAELILIQNKLYADKSYVTLIK
jgi:hypothetical protein